MKRSLAAIALLTAAASLARAHFVVVVPEPDGASAKVFISETLQPDPAVGLQLIAGAKLNLRNARGQETLLNLVKTGDAYLLWRSRDWDYDSSMV